MTTIEKLDALSEQMRDGDKDRDKYYRAYQKMRHGDWSLPDEIDTSKFPWIHKVVSSIPHDAISTATRVIPGGRLVLRMTPLTSSPENKARANMIERILKALLRDANRRRQQSVQADYMESACTYATIASQVIDVPWQIKQLEGNNKNARRWKAALKYGRFMVNTYNPMDVHVRYSNFMPEAVLLDQVRTAQSVLDEFGSVAGLQELADNGENVRYRDFMDYDKHGIWCRPENGGKPIVVIAPDPHKLPFLNWVALMGGSSLESQPQHAYHGLLYSIYQTGQWESQNVVDTLRMSEGIKNFAKAKLAEEGNMTANPTTQHDAFDAEDIVYVTPGNQLKALPPNQIDPALSVISDVLGGRQSTSTVSQILMNGEIPQGTAFAAMNLMVLTAVGALKPYKELAEKAMAETFNLMLDWARYTQEDLFAYGYEKKDLGEQYVIPYDEIPERACIEVEMKPDTPTDMQSKANTAIMLMNSGIMDKETALEELGVEDPQAIIEAIYADMWDTTYSQAEIQDYIASQSAPEETPKELAAQEANAANAAQNEMAAGGGMMAAPNMGGLPPAMGNPNQTREMVNMADMAGNPLAQEGMA